MTKSTKISAEEILSGDSRRHNKNGDKPEDVWADSKPINFSDLDRILNFPQIDDFAGILSRANFKNDEVRIAYLQLIEKARRLLATLDPEDVWYLPAKGILQFLRDSLASTLGMLGFGKTLQLQAKTELVVPALMREQLGLPKAKKGQEEAMKGSDFRQETEDKEPRSTARS